MSRKVIWLIFLSVFISSITFFSYPFEGYFHYLIFIILFPGFIKSFGFPKLPFQIILFPLVWGIIQIIADNNTIALFAKIMTGVLLSSVFYFYVIQYFHQKINIIFKIYLNGVFIVAVIGLIQVFSYYIGFKRGYDYSWILNKGGPVVGSGGTLRLNSVFTESSQYAIFISPSLFIVIHSIIKNQYLYFNKLQCILILVSLLLTSSSTGFIGLFIVGLLISINYGTVFNYILISIVLIALGNALYINSPEFRDRVNAAQGLWIDNDFSVKNVNTSSFILYNNYHIAFENVKNTLLLGSGLGSHPVAFEKYTLTKLPGILKFEYNSADANSLFLRLLSETGLLGIIFIFYFIFKFYVLRNPEGTSHVYWQISNSLLVIILLYLVRQGNYFLNGFPLFMWMYYYNHLNYKKTLSPVEEVETE